MLMPTTVASPLPTVMTPGQASTMVTPTSASVVPTVTTTIQPIQQKDTTWTKLFVGGLPYHTTDKSLREHFEVYGDIEEAVVITDRSTGKSRGYGFVIMSTKEAAERACKEPNPIIDGRKANVNLAILGAKPRGNLTAQLPLTALRPGFPALLGGQYGQPVQQQASNPYLQQLYAAAASPYGQLSPNIMQLMQASTGNPLMDMYSQYAAAGYPCASAVTQPQMCPVTQSLSLDAQQANAAMAGGYLGYAYAPITAQQLSAAGLSAAAGLPAAYAAAAGPTTAAGAAQQQPTDTRIQ
eukprot:GFUD01028641.1.p1 GENE.GFUD01028641.1~~GFUD01028641.1.p1  ORF type:complete len:296 (-),score=77.25 GFUD01028641.1:1301-2188(-)